MTITLNGRPHDVPDGATLDDLVARLALPDRGIALALDQDVVPRSAWPRTVLRDDAQVEVVTAMQGG